MKCVTSALKELHFGRLRPETINDERLERLTMANVRIPTFWPVEPQCHPPFTLCDFNLSSFDGNEVVNDVSEVMFRR
jgi:hypothetical protein